jgi:hypothetical protein
MPEFSGTSIYRKTREVQFVNVPPVGGTLH